MRRHAKASSAGSTDGTGNSRGLFRRAVATRGAFSEVEGSGASSSRRAPIALLVALAMIAALAFGATPASANTAEIGTISGASYNTAHVTGKISGAAFFTNYNFQFSKDPEAEGWNPGPGSGFLFLGGAEQEVNGDFAGFGLRGATKYFVRLVVSSSGGAEPEAFSPEAPGPYPSFTTLPVDPPTLPGPVAASPVFSTSATATGKVKRPTNNPDPAFNITKCRFEYVTDADFTATGFAAATPVPCEQPLPFEAPEGETDVTAHLTGLSPSTTYHLRLAAENAAPNAATKEAAATFTTEPKVAKPTVLATDDATDVTVHGAKFSGEVQRPSGTDPALDVECRFEFVNDAQFTATGFAGAGSTPCAENPITAATADGEGKQKVHAEFGSFSPATTWHFRLAAENSGGVDTKDAANIFTTEPAELPTVTIDPVAGGTYTTAHVSGTVDVDDPGHHEAYAYIEVSSDGGVNWDGGSVPNPSHSGVNVVERNVTGLQPNSTYTFRIKSTYSGGFPQEVEANGEMAFSPEPNPSITTEALFAPTAEDLEVTGVTATTAQFSAIVDPHAPGGTLSELGKKAFATHWEFVCTPECKNANGNPIEGTVQGEEGAQPVAGDAKRLEPNTHYEVTLVIHSEGGGETIGPEPFDTLFVKPTVNAAPGGSDGKGGYTLQGVVNPNNSPVTDCKFEWGPNSSHYDFSAPCSPAPGAGAKPVTVEAHLSGLTPGATYHAKLVTTNGAGTEDGGDQTFVPTFDSSGPACPNEVLRTENNSLALPECRAYEQVTAPNKAGSSASLTDYTDSGAIAYQSKAGNIANSGGGGTNNDYAASRTSAGWETLSNLNGPTGSPDSEPGPPYSEFKSPSGQTGVVPFLGAKRKFLREPDGGYVLVGPISTGRDGIAGVSADLSHVFYTPNRFVLSPFGQGVYEVAGPGGEGPVRRADLDNSGGPITACTYPAQGPPYNARAKFNSKDGRVFVFTVAGGCGGSNPPANEVWARINGTTSFDVSASQCTRTAADPGGACNAPAGSGGCENTPGEEEVGLGCRGARFQGAAQNGSRVYFTTIRQLVNGDTDETNDLYACDIPSGSQAPSGTANSCSSLKQVSGAAPGANVEEASAISEDGSTAYFIASGVLSANPGALGEAASPGNHNLYVWRQSAAHPAGQTTFIARLDSNDFGDSQQATPDGRYLIISTGSQLVPTDTDNARDVYRYDADTGVIARVSTNTSGVGGNAASFDAVIHARIGGLGTVSHSTHVSVSEDGEAIVFTTSEPLSTLDGNGEPDVYLWKAGHVSLISTGSVGGGASSPAISDSGKDIYFGTSQALAPSDGDDAADVYDARIEGGFSFAPVAACSGETCRAMASAPPTAPAPATAQGPAYPGNVKPCLKGKVAKGTKCIKKHHKKHKKKSKGHTKRASHNGGGSE